MIIFLRSFCILFLWMGSFAIQNTYAVYPVAVKSRQGMVVTEQNLASEAGAAVLKQGGNAIDAAVAIGYALAVTQPCCGNIGGGGFMLIHLANGNNTFINFREKAPLAAKADMFLDKNGQPIPDKSLRGFAAVAVPGTVMGLDYALQKYGVLTREKVMAPAIKLAREGFVVQEADVPRLVKVRGDFALPSNVAGIFLKDGKPFQAGQRLLQTDLANTLSLIATQGSAVFYQGSIAAEVVKYSKAQGGFLSMEDFAHYTVQELSPLQCSYRGYTVLTAPPPSSGGVTLCEILGILEGYNLGSLGYHSAQSVHYIIEAMRYAFADRNNKLGDPDFIKNPVSELISKKYTDKLRKNIQDYRATPSSELPYTSQILESTDTTHYSVADKAGNLVAVTYTLNGLYGARVIAGQTGFFLNNEMDDFSLKAGVANQFGLVQGDNNAIQPAKRPLSSMTPAMIFYQGKPVLVLGSPGGPRIITSVLQTILNLIDYGMDIKAAVDAPRFHHQWLPDYVDMEKFTFSQDTLEKLAAMGYRFRIRALWSVVEAIAVGQGPLLYSGASDDREPAGSAVGWE